MTDRTEDLKTFIRAALRAGFEPVPSVRAASGKVHLEVWRSRSGRGYPVGLEMGHDSMVNYWVTRPFGLPPNLPPTVERTDKQPKGREWTGADGDGANSNLSAYEEFRTKPIARLAVRSADDARLILEHLTR